MFGFSIYLFNQTDFVWWWFPALILLPDISMLGYVINPRVGGILYNVFHHKAVGVILMIGGWHLDSPWLLLMGIILFGHASLDRIFGYGLKYSDSFKNTHLGMLR